MTDAVSTGGVPWQTYVDQLFSQIDRQFAAGDHAVEVALEQVREALTKSELLQVERVEGVRREAMAALVAQNLAIQKSDVASTTRYDDRQSFVDATFSEHQKAINANERLQIERIEALRREASIQADSVRREASATFDANNAAIVKSDMANEKRFTSVDELRAQLQEQDNHYVTREVADSQFNVIRAQLGDLAQLKANELLQVERVEALRRETQVLREASATAIEKSETATEKRFENVNEFRGQLQDQALTFMRGDVGDAQFAEFRTQIAQLNKRVDESSGGAAASQRLIGVGMAAITVVISVIVFLANYVFAA